MSGSTTGLAGRYSWHPYAYPTHLTAVAPGSFLGRLTPNGWTQCMGFGRAFYSGLEYAAELAAEDFADQPNEGLWEQAIVAIQKFAGYVPAPLVMPLQLGGLSVEWHVYGLDLELRFRSDQPPFVLIDDVQRECAEFRGRDPDLLRAAAALERLAARSSQSTSLHAAG